MVNAPHGAIEAVPMTIVSKLEHGDLLVTDAHKCMALEVFALNTSSPNSASISSTTSSSMAELFGSPGLANEDGGDTTSAVSTTSGRYDPERPLDCGRISLASNIHSPIIEEGPSMSTNKGDMDHISEDIDLDAKPSFNEACFLDTCCRQDSSSDDMFISRLDELLQTDTPQEFAAESSLPCVDDLFPSLSNTGQEFSLLDGMSTWSMESLQSLEVLPFPEEEIMQAELAFGGEESASQMFTQWLQNNAHWISLSDLRKIKLKTSTIENATRRLGGGKKGLICFLKFVLMWVQSSQMKRAGPAEPVPANGAMQSMASPASGTSAMSMEGIPMRHGLSALESACALQASRVHAQTLSGSSSPLPPITVNSSCPDWTTRAGWTQPPAMEHNLAIPTPNRFSPVTNGRAGSPFPSSTFGHSNRTWPLHRNMLSGVAPSSMSPSLRSSANGGISCIGGRGIGNPASMMMMMQQECSEANPAATTRAARKNRMERQRWSVRRNRKWSTTSHQSQQHLAAEVSNRGVSATLPVWSQVMGNAPPNLPFSSVRAYQQRPSSRSAVMECQQNKKPERNVRLLFHKQLKQSDVGNLGRIVLPKAAETCLPPLDLRDGMNLVVEDMNSAKIWNMRYRFWPNNKSRMYLLENTGDFVKSYDLKEGDYMMLFRDNLTNRFVIKGAEGPGQAATLSGAAGIEDISDASGVANGAKKRRSSSKEEADVVLMGSMNSEESCDDSLLAELIEQSLEVFKESSETEMREPLKAI